jgi:hypothetical protein
MKKILIATLLAAMLAIPALAVDPIDPAQPTSTETMAVTTGFCGFVHIEREDRCTGGLYVKCERKWVSLMRGDGTWACVFSEKCTVLGRCDTVQASD